MLTSEATFVRTGTEKQRQDEMPTARLEQRETELQLLLIPKNRGSSGNKGQGKIATCTMFSISFILSPPRFVPLPPALRSLTTFFPLQYI